MISKAAWATWSHGEDQQPGLRNWDEAFMWLWDFHSLARSAGQVYLVSLWIGIFLPCCMDIRWQTLFVLSISNFHLLENTWLDCGTLHFQSHEKGFDSEMVGVVPTPSTVAKGWSPCSNTKDDGVMISFFHLNYSLPDYMAEAPGKMTKAQRYLIIVPHNYEHYLSSSLISNVPFPLSYILRSMFSARLIWSMNPCWRVCD